MNQEKNNKLVLPVVFLCLLVLGLGGYIIYDKVLNNKEIPQTPTSSYDYNLTKRTTNQAVRQDYIEVMTDTDGNAYLYTIGNVDSEDNSQTKTNLKKVEEQFKTYSPKGYNNYGVTELKAYKLDISSVLTTYYVHMGNGGFSYFVFLKENGTLSYLSYDKIIYDGKIELKHIDNLENIVSVVENTYSMTPYAITLSGNEISLHEYIKY